MIVTENSGDWGEQREMHTSKHTMKHKLHPQVMTYGIATRHAKCWLKLIILEFKVFGRCDAIAHRKI
jgi:hypothetical protein